MSIKFVRVKGLLKFEYFLLTLILLGSFSVRLYKINNPVADWHSWRQADTASVTRFFIKDGLDLFRPRYHDISSLQTGYENSKGWRFVEFPIFNWFHAVLFKNLGIFSLEVWGRLVSIFAALVSTLLLFLIGRRFLGTAGGILASFFFAALPFNIYFTRVILPEPLSVTFGLGALWFFILWTDKEKVWQILASSLLFALAILVKPFIVFYGVAILYLAVQKFGILGIFSQFWLWVFGTISLIPFFAWRAWMWKEDFLVGIPFWSWVFNGDQIRFKPSFWYWIFGERLGNLILGGWGIFPFVAAFMKKSKNWFPQMFALGAFLYIAIVATANVRHDYYQTLIVPQVALLLAWGTILVWNLKGLNWHLVRLGLVGCLLLGFALSFYRVREFYKINHPEIIRAGETVKHLTPQEAKIIAPYNGDTAFLYQTGRVGWPHVTLPMEEMISKLGAQYYVSVNFDQQTLEVMENYKVLEKTDEYVVIDLKNK